jgi:hypothetical protein
MQQFILARNASQGANFMHELDLLNKIQAGLD